MSYAASRIVVKGDRYEWETLYQGKSLFEAREAYLGARRSGALAGKLVSPLTGILGHFDRRPSPHSIHRKRKRAERAARNAP